ncbi:MAG: metallophosphoesterase [Chloroflexota bacterium]
MTRLFFATDVHGSDICWKKFLNAAKFYSADVLILGGDMTGKALVPITRQPDGTYLATLLQQAYQLKDEAEVVEMERRVRSRGYYPIRLTADQLAELEADPSQIDHLFRQQALSVLEQWLALADEKLRGTSLRCYVCPGNDDAPEVDEVIGRAHHVQMGEGKTVELGDGFVMVSTGWSNVTPWHTYRECSETDMAAKIEAMMPASADLRRTVFSFHCPPYGSNLDEAPLLDENLNVKEAGRALVPVGSTAVRDAILKYQPVLSLHGHIHESKGVARLGKTLSINPGSLYEQGVLQGVVVDLDGRKGVKSYTLTTG